MFYSAHPSLRPGVAHEKGPGERGGQNRRTQPGLGEHLGVQNPDHPPRVWTSDAVCILRVPGRLSDRNMFPGRWPCSPGLPCTHAPRNIPSASVGADALSLARAAAPLGRRLRVPENRGLKASRICMALGQFSRGPLQRQALA